MHRLGRSLPPVAPTFPSQGRDSGEHFPPRCSVLGMQGLGDSAQAPITEVHADPAPSRVPHALAGSSHFPFLLRYHVRGLPNVPLSAE